MELRPQTQLHLALILLTYVLIQPSSASASFSSLQSIVGFSPACTLAYDTPINSCDDNDFPGVGGSGSCSADCQSSLMSSQAFVQRFCAGQKAGSDTIIGHLFVGDIVNFLCGTDNNAATSAQTTQATTSAQSITSTAAPQTTTNSVITSTSSFPATTASSSSESTSQTTLSTSTSASTRTVSKTSSTSLPTSIQSATSNLSSETSSTATSASATRIPSPQNSGDGSGGGSPFDGAFTAGAAPRSIRLDMLSLSCVLILALTLS